MYYPVESKRVNWLIPNCTVRSNRPIESSVAAVSSQLVGSQSLSSCRDVVQFEFGSESSAGLSGMLTGAIGATPCLGNHVRVGHVAISVRGLALKDWKRPSVEELTVPREPWAKVHRRNQRKFNLQLAVGVVLGGYTAFTLFHNVVFNGTPSPLINEKTKQRTQLPEEIKSCLAEMQETGAAKTYLGLNQIKDAPIQLKLFAEEKCAKDGEEANKKTD